MLDPRRLTRLPGQVSWLTKAGGSFALPLRQTSVNKAAHVFAGQLREFIQLGRSMSTL